MRADKTRPREKGTSAGRDKRSKAKGRQQVAGRSGQGSEKYESQESSMHLMQAPCNKKSPLVDYFFL